MLLKCKGCGGNNTEVVSAKELSEKTGDASIMTSATGTINPILVLEVFKNIFKAMGKLFGWLEEKEKGKRKVVVCKDCGHWDKI